MAQKCCWHALPARNPQLQSRICIHPNTSTAQGAAGIVPLDGAIVKELGFVFQAPSRTCPGSAGKSWPSLPWSDALRQEVDPPGKQRRGRRDGSPTESVGSCRWEKLTNFHSGCCRVYPPRFPCKIPLVSPWCTTQITEMGKAPGKGRCLVLICPRAPFSSQKESHQFLA